MLLRLVGAALLASALGCAGPSVTLDAYEGVYTTHFEGIPDDSRVCALVRNGGTESVSWVRMRLRSFTEFEGRRSRVTSSWVYRGNLAPGQSVAVELHRPPVAPEIRLSLRGSGNGRGPRGRSVRRSKECTEAGLLERATTAHERRVDANVEVLLVRRRGSASDDALLLADPTR
jgi:hypothetical protein